MPAPVASRPEGAIVLILEGGTPRCQGVEFAKSIKGEKPLNRPLRHTGASWVEKPLMLRLEHSRCSRVDWIARELRNSRHSNVAHDYQPIWRIRSRMSSPVVIHALGTPLPGAQNRGEPCRLVPGQYSGPGFRVRHADSAPNTRAPFDHVEVELQNALLCRGLIRPPYQRELRALAEE